MTVTILCTDPQHPVVPFLLRWQLETEARGHSVALCFDKSGLEGGDVLFLVSCGQMIGAAERAKFRAALVLHASDLPNARGWSPHIWAILDGASQIVVCLLEASDPVDTGDVWLRTEFALEGHELLPEINAKLFAAEGALMSAAIECFDTIRPSPQVGERSPALRRRRPEDSRLDPERPLAEQFNLLRVVDNERYPAFMDHRGKRYILRIEKAHDDT